MNIEGSDLQGGDNMKNTRFDARVSLPLLLDAFAPFCLRPAVVRSTATQY